jgi:predicted regulator of Ras-like GTPase activity (Roadblock/LC7/MglB family)
MQSVLQSLNSISGVKGGLLTDDTGGVIANSLPDSFSLPTLQAVCTELNFKVLGFQDPTGGTKQFDLRFEHGRIILRSFGNFYLLLLCEPAINLQLLSLSMNVAVNKLEKLILQSPKPLKYLAAEVVVEPQEIDSPIPKLHKPQLRSAKLLERFNKEFS